MTTQSVLKWEEIEQFATIKHLKKQLTRKGKRQRLSSSTWRSYRYGLMKLLKFTEKTPDLLIEEALQDNEETENMLIEFKNSLIDSGIDENVAINVTHGCVRGFFRHNNVNTLNWVTPAKTERKVEQIDENNPMFVRQDKNGKKRLVLNRELLREFQSKLSHRDQIILDCLISSGLDSGDLLKLNIGLVRNQSADRIFINSHRAKTLTTLRTFLSLTASKRLRTYVNRERAKAVDEDPIFVISDSERKKIFKRVHGVNYDPYNNPEHLNQLPDGHRLSGIVLAINFRNATTHMNIHVPKGEQSPLRPKRLRKIFESACTHAGIESNIKDLFMGHLGTQSKTYEGKSRDELEYYYEKVEPMVTIQLDEENDEIDRLHENLKNLKSRLEIVEKQKEDVMTEKKKIVKEKESQLTIQKQATELLQLSTDVYSKRDKDEITKLRKEMEEVKKFLKKSSKKS